MPGDLAAALAAYDYVFPPALLAKQPASPRDSAKLLVYERASGRTRLATVAAIGDFLPPGTVLVRNITKVIPAKLIARRETGGKVEMLVIAVGADHLNILADRRLRSGDILTLGAGATVRVGDSLGRGWRLEPVRMSPAMLLKRFGRTPLPPYMKDSPLTESERRAKYQSVFAKTPGSVAAPTASLHFTPRLIARLKKRGVRFVDVVLHVNLGTFAPLTDEQWRTGKLHQEHFMIPKATIAALAKAKQEGNPIIPIGTTALRALESAASAGPLRAHGITDLFIREGYEFKMVSGLMTNFHVPRSSLLMLVGALIGQKTVMDLYRRAIRRRFRLFSFGDAMLVV